MLEDADKNIQVNKNLVKILIESQESQSLEKPKLDKLSNPSVHNPIYQLNLENQ